MNTAAEPSEPKLRLYLETTVFNFYFDDREGHDDVVELFERIKAGEFEAYTSEFTMRELERASEPKRGMMLELAERYTINMDWEDSIDDLAARYVENGIIPKRYMGDAVHIAAASIAGLDCIVSYNFKHINRLKTKMKTREINALLGIKGIEFCTAREVINYEEHV